MADLTRFLEDIKNHKMTVEHDDGVHRSILFRDPKTCNHAFRITTWPYHLCISGDTSTYVFSRLEDMFEFFEDSYENPCLGYISGKVQSVCKNGGLTNISEKKAKAAMHEHVEDLIGHPLPFKEFEQWLENEELNGNYACFDDEAEFYNFLYGQHHSDIRGTEVDFTELALNSPNIEEYSYSFTWCVRAICWAVNQYKKEKQVI